MGSEELKKYVAPPNAPRAILVDIDGTVADHFDEVGQQLRGHYEYSKVLDDLPMPDIIEIVQALQDAGNYVIFMSGREDFSRNDTVEWLARYGFEPGSYKLFMRVTGDHRKDFVIKYEIFRAHIADYYDILCVIDDRTQVVQMWRSIGVRALQVADGNF